jgi:hypothetical protein
MQGQSCLVCSHLVPREGADTRFDHVHRKWQGRTFVSAWDQDPPPITAEAINDSAGSPMKFQAAY